MLEVRILGPLEVLVEGKPVRVGRPKHRALLTLLTLHAGEIVATDRLIDELWAGRPPRSAKVALQTYVSELRKALGRDELVTTGPGYLLRLDPDQIDRDRFERLVEEARALPRASKRVEQLGRALELWRGPALVDVAYEPFAELEAARLEELRVSVREDLFAAELELGCHAELLPELERLAAERPFDERVCALLMLALYRAGRQADALERYREARQTLIEELGLEPSMPLRELEQQILRHDSSLDRVAQAPPGLRESRRTVTVLFADLVRSSELSEALDPESLRGLLDRYFAVLRTVIERHGGTVEKFTGDAVMAVFGVPIVHEDDALRAVRAAVEIQTGVRELHDQLQSERGIGLELRIGVNTGEVFVGGVDAFVTGNTVTMAKRLEQSAAPGEILLGGTTLTLVRDAVSAVAVRPPLATRAFLLEELREGAPAIARYFEAPLVGRERELASLQQAYETAKEEQACAFVVVVGEPGVGKTRLVRELIAPVGKEATVLVGRCVSYGEGATFLPLREMVGQIGGGLRVVLADDQQGELLAQRVEELVGVGAGGASLEEGFWAVRRLCEALARERPLLLVFEDVHWAEPTLLDLIEHISARASAPITIVCTARPELLDERSWESHALLLRPLPSEEVASLVASLPGGGAAPVELRTRVVEIADGNPLFAEQLLAHLLDHGRDALESVPPSVEALLASRLDLLDSGERATVQRAAVIGREFSRATLVALSQRDAAAVLSEHLLGLIRRGLVQPARAPSHSEEVFRFHHVLVRDVAYSGLAFAQRAELHERLGGWLEEGGYAPGEIVGYHLEQAVRYRRELGHPGERIWPIAGRAAGFLGTAGQRALQRGDPIAAADLLDRATSLLPSGTADRLQLLLEFAYALLLLDEMDRSKAVVEEALEGARSIGDERLELDALMMQVELRADTDPGFLIDEFAVVARRALPVFEAAEDERGQARAWNMIWMAHWWKLETAAAFDAAQHAVEHASRSGDRRLKAEALHQLVRPVMWGPWPIDECLKRAHEIGKRSGGHPWVEITVLEAEAHLTALKGRFDEAGALLAEAEAIVAGIGMRWPHLVRRRAWIAILAGDLNTAEQTWRTELEGTEKMDRIDSYFCLLGLAEALCLQGRHREAEPLISAAQELMSANDALSRVACSLEARVLAARGSLQEAKETARKAVAAADATDSPDEQANSIMTLAEVLHLAGRADEARAEATRALGLYASRGNIVGQRSARSLLRKVGAHLAPAT